MVRTLFVTLALLTFGSAPALADEHARLQCRDGTVLWGKPKDCKHRGGVARVLPPPRPYGYGRPRRAPGPAVARCRDGTLQEAWKKTCKYNGGVARWL
jgi:hypothetical protein